MQQFYIQQDIIHNQVNQFAKFQHLVPSWVQIIIRYLMQGRMSKEMEGKFVNILYEKNLQKYLISLHIQFHQRTAMVIYLPHLQIDEYSDEITMVKLQDLEQQRNFFQHRMSQDIINQISLKMNMSNVGCQPQKLLIDWMPQALLKQPDVLHMVDIRIEPFMILEYKNSQSTTINHFHEKLLHLKDMMNSKTGREL
ncbi:hypothetical protein pb186bvf_019885 [Paramecium bursaria]